MPAKESETVSMDVLRKFFATCTHEEKLEVFDRVTYSDGRPDDSKVTESSLMRALTKRGIVKEQLREDWLCSDEEFERHYARSLEDPQTTQ